MSKVAIIQSNYIPWKGYFDIINYVDAFIFLDDVQYTNRDWRNRNKIKGKHGENWLSIPVGSSTKRLINEVEVLDNSWPDIHANLIEEYYRTAPFYSDYSFLVNELYKNATITNLSKYNQYVIRFISDVLGIKTSFYNSSQFNAIGAKDEKLINLLTAVDATEYVSGPAGKNYIDSNKFSEKNIKLSFFDYSGYREYKQLSEPFNHYVSILDLFFCTGDKASDYMLTFT
ncbi:WbqC family protein [Sulfuriflexus mobilis]|uniref:WbqC family protein n=1 Tax=Sulfuriflexus mobilis TaxID=1811807 RepID=UPI000F81EAF3|nr:WbqC family protein [Sulfuriflexus mobilis]